MPHHDQERWAQAKRLLGEAAAASVTNHTRLGLGSGSTVAACIQALGHRVRHDGLELHCIVASEASRRMAEAQGIRVESVEVSGSLDYAIDGADYVDSVGTLIKGGGGALVRERMLLESAIRTLILIDDSKPVASLDRCVIPVAVVPFGWRTIKDKLLGQGAEAELRRHGDQPFMTDDGLFILDTRWNRVSHPLDLHRQLKLITGVVETGIFVGYHNHVWISDGTGVTRWTPEGPEISGL